MNDHDLLRRNLNHDIVENFPEQRVISKNVHVVYFIDFHEKNTEKILKEDNQSKKLTFLSRDFGATLRRAEHASAIVCSRSALSIIDRRTSNAA